ncbi:MAG: STAS domain-containing protein [Chlorobium sp.]|nr:STAS domain-containing protein [Chlorobium sp.]
MTIIEKNINNFTIISLKGILNASSAPQLKTHIEQSPESQSLIIDLEQVDFLDSSGLGVLVGIARKKKVCGALLKLSNLNDRVKKVFELTKAYTLFDIYDDLAAAAI